MIAYAMSQKGVTINGQLFVLNTADTAFPQLVATLLPAGIKGMVVCGILAALMSSSGIAVQFVGNAVYHRFL
jgi:SSS family solute:Na+ symporter